MRLLGRFLKDRWKLLCFFAGCAAIFAAVFFLYRLSLEPVLYAALLCMALGLLVHPNQFLRFCHRHKQRPPILRQPDLLYREMPEPQTLEEEDDNAILQAFGEQYQKLLGDWQAQKSDSMDYYGAWVHQIKTPIAVMKMLLQHEDTPESRMLSDELFRIEQYAEMASGQQRQRSGIPALPAGRDSPWRHPQICAAVHQPPHPAGIHPHNTGGAHR